jgi:hypothetical protein
LLKEHKSFLLKDLLHVELEVISGKYVGGDLPLNVPLLVLLHEMRPGKLRVRSKQLQCVQSNFIPSPSIS